MSHYSKGSKKPALKSDGLRLYSMRFCPYAQRARLVLAAKGIKYECVNINLKDKPEWFLKLNPLGKVPVIETPDGKVLYESALCCEFLEDLYPEIALFPKDPFEKHRQRLLVETLGSKISGAVYKVHFQGTEDSRADLDKQLAVFNEELKSVKKPFLGGDNPGMADYLIWPWIERIAAVQTISGYDMSKFDAVANWHINMKDLPAVKECSTPAELHIKFAEAYKAGKSDSQLLGTQ